MKYGWTLFSYSTLLGSLKSIGSRQTSGEEGKTKAISFLMSHAYGVWQSEFLPKSSTGRSLVAHLPGCGGRPCNSSPSFAVGMNS